MGKCELTGKGPVVKNLVSHSNIKTKSVALPNIQKKRLFSKTLNSLVRLRVAASAIKSMEHMGGFDTFFLGQSDSKLSDRARDVKNRIKRKMKPKKAKVEKVEKVAKAATSEKVVKKAKAKKA